MNIAMWSGPRNLSTAMMYAFAARGDCAVWDEPFYAAYLARSGRAHPMREQILAAGETDPDRVIARCVAPGEGVSYQKHMAQHMVAGIDRSWIADVVNVFLIRHPARVVASFAEKYEDPTLEEIGFRQQAEIFALARSLGQAPVVIDSTDIRADPAAALAALCVAIGLEFTRRMLSWPAGGHPQDGVWAAHWYGAVHRSTGFAGPEGPLPQLRGRQGDLAAAALPFYEALRAERLGG